MKLDSSDTLADLHGHHVAQDIAADLHPFTKLATHMQSDPVVMVRGDGIHMEEDRGWRYLESMSGLWCASLGFSNAQAR